MRRGKEIAQGAHASMDFLVERMKSSSSLKSPNLVSIVLSEDEIEWISGGMAKVCLQVDSEEDLKTVCQKAQAAGLETMLRR